MATKVVRISEDAIEITGRYAKDISEAIRMMQKLIEEKKHAADRYESSGKDYANLYR